MKMMSGTRKSGFTLIEIIVAMTIAVIMSAVAYNILFSGMRSHSESVKSFENQSEVRVAIESTNNAIRFSTVCFAVTADDFDPTLEGDGSISGLVKPWNYIGLSYDGKSIVHYKYNSVSNAYNMSVLVNAVDGYAYTLTFDKTVASKDNKIIRYTLKSNKNGSTNIVTTEVDALNAIQVINWGDASKPAIALAYRTEETPEIDEKPVAALSIVLDTSGSMLWGMNGQGTTTTGVNGTNPVRLTLLKDTLTDGSTGIFKLLDQSDVYVSLVPFSFNANMPHGNYNGLNPSIDATKFYSVKTEKSTLSLMTNSLEANGATNIGDGIRRAYFQIKSFDTNKVSYIGAADRTIKNYMVILVDGVTTAASASIQTEFNGSVWEGVWKSYVTDSRSIGASFYTSNASLSGYNRLVTRAIVGVSPLDRPIGDGVNLDTVHGETYVTAIGNLIKTATPKIDQCFVIGYSNFKGPSDTYPELQSLSNIAISLGITVGVNEAAEKFANNDFVFVATDEESLNKAFENIGDYINENLWQVEGPQLNP